MAYRFDIEVFLFCTLTSKAHSSASAVHKALASSDAFESGRLTTDRKLSQSMADVYDLLSAFSVHGSLPSAVRGKNMHQTWFLLETYYLVEQWISVHEELRYPVYNCPCSKETMLSFTAKRTDVHVPHWDYFIQCLFLTLPPDPLTWSRGVILTLFSLGIFPLSLQDWVRYLPFLISFSKYFNTVGPPYPRALHPRDQRTADWKYSGGKKF